MAHPFDKFGSHYGTPEALNLDLRHAATLDDFRPISDSQAGAVLMLRTLPNAPATRERIWRAALTQPAVDGAAAA
jgi:hypothetical protein